MPHSETIASLPALRPFASAQTPGGRSPGGDAGFVAQALGQAGVRRGLRAGAPLIAHARSAYLSAEWSGPGDRRLSPGALAHTAV